MIQAYHGIAAIVKLESMIKRRKETLTCYIYNEATKGIDKVNNEVYFWNFFFYK